MSDFINKLDALIERGGDIFEWIEPENEPDEIKRFEKSEISANINLRTLFDFLSHEWKETTMKEKMESIKKIAKKEKTMKNLIDDYTAYYKQQNRRDIVEALSPSLGLIIDFLMDNDAPFMTKEE